MVDGSAFAGEMEERNIRAVPTVFRGGEVFSQGAVSEEQILEKLDVRAAGNRENKLGFRHVREDGIMSSSGLHHPSGDVFKVPSGVATDVAPLVRAPASARRRRKALGTG